MQTTYNQNRPTVRNRRDIQRLTPADYSNAGLLKSYDWSAQDREAHDKTMQKYRQYLMKLCALSLEITDISDVEAE